MDKLNAISALNVIHRLVYNCPTWHFTGQDGVWLRNAGITLQNSVKGHSQSEQKAQALIVQLNRWSSVDLTASRPSKLILLGQVGDMLHSIYEIHREHASWEATPVATPSVFRAGTSSNSASPHEP